MTISHRTSYTARCDAPGGQSRTRTGFRTPGRALAYIAGAYLCARCEKDVAQGYAERDGGPPRPVAGLLDTSCGAEWAVVRRRRPRRVARRRRS